MSSPSNYPSYGNKVKSGQKIPEFVNTTLLLLNWVSFCLVSDATLQSITASLVTDTTRKEVTFLLSSNIPISDTQREYTYAFFEALLRLISRSLPAPQQDSIEGMFVLVTEHAWKRIHRKASLINRFKGKRGDDTQPIAKLRCLVAENGPETNGELIRTKDTKPSSHSPFPAVESKFLNDMREKMDEDIFTRGDPNFICQLYRRVHRLYFYLNGARTLFNSPSKLSSLSQEGWSIKHEWIPPVILPLPLPQSSDEYISDVLREYGYTPQPDAFKDVFAKYRESWEAGETVTLRVHAEARMAEYLKQHDIVPVKNAVGCSKRPCRPCAECVFLTWDKFGRSKPWSTFGRGPEEPWLITQYSAKHCADWLCPNIVGQMQLDNMKAYEQEFKKHYIKDRYPNYGLRVQEEWDSSRENEISIIF